MALIDLNEANWEAEVIRPGLPALVYFGAEWCPACRAQKPALLSLAERYAGHACVGAVDVDTERRLARRFRISSIPQLLLFKGADRPVRVFTPGVHGEAELAAELDRLLLVSEWPREEGSE